MYYPVMLDLRGRRAVVVGGGTVAEQKVRGLLEARARVTVIGPTLTAGLERLGDQGAIAVERRPYREGDLAGARIAIAATDDRTVNHAVWIEAESRGVPLNAVDDVDHCHFIAPSIHRQGEITVAVSTAGRCPALAVRLRERITDVVRPEHARFADLAGGMREEIARRIPDFGERTRLWYRIVDSDAIELVRRGEVLAAQTTIESLIREQELGPAAPAECRVPSAECQGGVFLVGAGPGDPGLITARGLELLRSADVVVHDRLVSAELLAHAAPGAKLVDAGKQGHGPSCSQERINQLMIEAARRGHRVVRLKGGDPYVFGRGAEEAERLREAGIEVEVVPGVSSALAAPAAAGIAVTHRALGSGFAVVTGHECGEESDLDWAALARLPTLVVLMGLRALPTIVARLLAHGVPPDRPAAMIANATLPTQQVVAGDLCTLPARVAEAGLESPATLVIGEVVRLHFGHSALGARHSAAPS